MDDDLDPLMVEVRANTQGFKSYIDRMRTTFDTGLLDGFSKAGNVLERGLLSAIRKGTLGFDDLKRVALSALEQIASQALKLGLDSIFGKGEGSGGGGSNGLMGLVQGSVGGLFGFPGRETGGLVSPDRPYVVGERGPELFVPDSAGRIDNGRSAGAGPDRAVRVNISLAPERGGSQPVALRRSSRQVASAVRRALSQ